MEKGEKRLAVAQKPDAQHEKPNVGNDVTRNSGTSGSQIAPTIVSRMMFNIYYKSPKEQK